MEIHPSARKHRIADEDIEHAVTTELAMHAMRMRPRYQRLLAES